MQQNIRNDCTCQFHLARKSTYKKHLKRDMFQNNGHSESYVNVKEREIKLVREANLHCVD